MIKMLFYGCLIFLFQLHLYITGKTINDLGGGGNQEKNKNFGNSIRAGIHLTKIPGKKDDSSVISLRKKN